jgi:cell wall-associated NlpC family hydrolase
MMESKPKTLTPEEIIKAAKSLLGTPFRHQGRSAKTGVDCVGFLMEIGKRVDYDHEVMDRTTYKRIPDESIALKYLRLNMNEIPLEEVGIGDVITMRIAGKEVHVGVKIDDTRFIHARNKGGFSGSVQLDYIKNWKDYFVRGFRLKGI